MKQPTSPIGMMMKIQFGYALSVGLFLYNCTGDVSVCVCVYEIIIFRCAHNSMICSTNWISLNHHHYYYHHQVLIVSQRFLFCVCGKQDKMPTTIPNNLIEHENNNEHNQKRNEIKQYVWWIFFLFCWPAFSNKFISYHHYIIIIWIEELRKRKHWSKMIRSYRNNDRRWWDENANDNDDDDDDCVWKTLLLLFVDQI